MKSITTLFFLSLFLPSLSIAATDNKGFCQNAQSTANLVTCIGDHYESETNRMGDEFKIVLDTYADDSDLITKIESNQQVWIKMRDQSCANEAAIYEGGSLGRVQELNCLARMTSARVRHLNNLIIDEDETVIREFSVIPRWVNVLKSDYSKIYWRFGQTQDVDLDCDQVNEKIVRGVKGLGEGKFEPVMAIADSDVTGKPKTNLLSFDLSKTCQITNDYKIMISEKDDNGSDEAKNECSNEVKVITKNCGDYNLTKQESGYTLIETINETMEQWNKIKQTRKIQKNND